MLDLITDRIQSDVALVKALSQIKYADMSPQQKAQWDSVLKGSYDYRDLNRVQGAVKYLQTTLDNYGYSSELIPMPVWGAYDKPLPEQLVDYLVNVRRIRDILPVVSVVPDSMEELSVEKANEIEKALLAVEDAVSRIELGWIPSGEALCGGDNL